jgi:hypothetical protein
VESFPEQPQKVKLGQMCFARDGIQAHSVINTLVKKYSCHVKPSTQRIDTLGMQRV